MANKYLTKISFKVSTETKKDLVNTGLIAGLGGLGNVAASKLLPAKASNAKVFAVGTGIGLLADYAGLKLTPHVGKAIEKLDNKKS